MMYVTSIEDVFSVLSVFVVFLRATVLSVISISCTMTVTWRLSGEKNVIRWSKTSVVFFSGIFLFFSFLFSFLFFSFFFFFFFFPFFFFFSFLFFLFLSFFYFV